MRRKYSKGFERDYKFYLNGISRFTFCGTLSPTFEAIHDTNGKTAKEVFFMIESTGKNHPTCEPELLNSLLLCKASVNFMIKQWAEGRADGTLPFHEFAGDGETLEWEESEFNGERSVKPVYKKSLAVEYGLPEWAIRAVEMQKVKILQESDHPNWFKEAVAKQKKRFLAGIFSRTSL